MNRKRNVKRLSLTLTFINNSTIDLLIKLSPNFIDPTNSPIYGSQIWLTAFKNSNLVERKEDTNYHFGDVPVIKLLFVRHVQWTSFVLHHFFQATGYIKLWIIEDIYLRCWAYCQRRKWYVPHWHSLIGKANVHRIDTYFPVNFKN